MFKNLKLGTKLIAVGLILTIIPLVVIAIVTFTQNQTMKEVTREESVKLANTDLDHIVEGVYKMVQSQQEVAEQRLLGSLKVARKIADDLGGLAIAESGEKVSWNAINQFTDNVTPVQLPKMMVGKTWTGQVMSANADVPLVDEVNRLQTVVCTIFQRMNNAGNMIRVSTTVVGKDGSRAIGKYVPATNPDGGANPVVSTILRGQTYSGRAFVVDKWYLTAYEPIFGENNNVIGMLGLGVPQESVKSVRQAIMDIEVGATGYVYVLDSKGHYVISQGGKRDGDDIWNAKDTDGVLFIQEIIGKALKLGSDEIAQQFYPWQNPGDPKPRMKFANIKYFEPWDWVIGAGSYEEEFLSGVNAIESIQNRGTTIFLVVILITIFATIIVWLFASRGIAGPIVRIADVIRRVAAERDLTLDVPVESTDEVGGMAQEFNNMMGALETAFHEVNANAAVLAKNAQEVAQRASANRERAEGEVAQSEKAVQVITEMRGTAGEVAQASNAQKDSAEKSNQSVAELLKAMEEVSESVSKQNVEVNNATERVGEMGATGGKVAQTAAEQSEMVKKVSSSVNEMTQAVEEMTKAVTRASEYGNASLAAADEGARSVLDTVAGMQEISESSEQIADIIGTITEIAEQTNLLALNAAIEAARAGEHGKGFAVVADEVGKLAQRSSEAAKEITQLIKVSTNRVNEGTKLTDASRNALQKIDEGGKINMQAIEEISKTASVLSEGTLQVQDLMNQLNVLAEEIGQMSQEQGPRREAAEKALTSLMEQAKAITGQVEDSNNGAQEISSAIEDILGRTEMVAEMTGLQAKRSQTITEISESSASGARQTMEGAGIVVGITEELQSSSDSLVEQVGQFKIKDDTKSAA